MTTAVVKAQEPDAGTTPSMFVDAEAPTEAQAEAAALLAAGSCYREAAEGVGVCRDTIYNWMKAGLRALVTRYRKEVAEQALGKLSERTCDAAVSLGRIAVGEVVPVGKQVDAINLLLGYTLGSSKGESRGLTLRGGADSFAGLTLIVGYPPGQLPEGLVDPGE